MNDSEAPYSQMLLGKRLLIVEDECFLAEEAHQKLRKLGATVIGPIGDIEHAANLIETDEADAVILDIYLDPKLAFPLVERLESLKLPYVFAIRRDPSVTTAGFTGFVLCEESSEIEHIAKALFGRSKQGI